MLLLDTLEAARVDSARIAALAKAQSGEDLSDMFQKLLLVQLKHQDPLDPVSNSEFLSQLAQLNSLNELKILNKNLSGEGVARQLSEAAAYIGKLVRGIDFEVGGQINGIVGSAIVEDGNVYLTLGEGRIKVADVLEVTDPSFVIPPEEEE